MQQDACNPWRAKKCSELVHEPFQRPSKAHPWQVQDPSNSVQPSLPLAWQVTRLPGGGGLGTATKIQEREALKQPPTQIKTFMRTVRTKICWARMLPEWFPDDKCLPLQWRTWWSFRWQSFGLFSWRKLTEKLPPKIHHVITPQISKFHLLELLAPLSCKICPALVLLMERFFSWSACGNPPESFAELFFLGWAFLWVFAPSSRVAAMMHRKRAERLTEITGRFAWTLLEV